MVKLVVTSDLVIKYILTFNCIVLSDPILN